ncbi:serine/threonine protein kinase [Yasminevirus sp. GU-2018]|uniref:Serine/threonine protein kinase n=1 Tax=Yasminevirus sp. GU-2018 TaxID=2420051 RepID=A0A5K0U9F6_9VIRU|nr:serine/threonine protein kinase [Yasminevirus sp. GU-2018]
MFIFALMIDYNKYTYTVIMSDDNKSLLSRMSRDENKDTIPNRIQFVKTLLHNNKLKPIIDFENTDTESFINKAKDDDSGESYDTRATLKKEVHEITDVINNMGGTLQYKKSGTTGHTFKGEERDKDDNILYEYAVKVVAYSIKDKYGSMHDTRRPENAELLMIKLLSYFIYKKRTPHIVLPIGTFDTSITNFTNLIEEGYVDKDNEKYKEFVERYNNGEYYDEVSVLISEWANRGDLNDFIKKNYKKFTLLHWKVLFFQLISTLAVIQCKFPTFRHNDLKANNVLVTKINRNVCTYWYKVVGDVYSVPNIGYQIKLWDFDFACIPGVVDNKKVMISNKWSRGINVGPTQNRYYDVHYFFNTLIKRGFFPELMTDRRVPQEVRDFVLSVVPYEYQSGDSVSKGGRILHNMEYTTPVDILRNNPFFAEFRVKQKEESVRPKQTIRAEPKIHEFLKSSETMMRPTRSSKGVDVSREPSRDNSRKETFDNIESIMKGAGANTHREVKSKSFKPKTFTKESSVDSDEELEEKVKEVPKKRATRSKTKTKSKSKSKSKSRSNSNLSKTKKRKEKTKTKSKSKSKKADTKTVKKAPVKKSTKKSVDELDIEEILMGKK